MTIRWLLVGSLLCLLLEKPVYSQDAQTIMVEAKASGNERLSPELFLITQVDGQFLGLTRDNHAVVQIKDDAIPKTVQAVKSVSVAPEEFTPVSLMVSFENAGLAAATLQAAGLEQVGVNENGKFVVAKPQDGVTAAEINALLQDQAVTYVAPDYILSLPDEFEREVISIEGATQQTPNDPLYPQLWGMENIHAPDAWDVITDAPKVVVAVIDTGVDYSHPDLAANMWTSSDGKHGYDFFSNDADPMDEHNHGTHCAGTIAGVGNNGAGVAGVTWKTQIMALRFLGPNGSGSTSDAIACIDWAVEHKANVLSNSWGGGGSSPELHEAISRAEQAGVLFVAAAGNSGTDNDTSPHYPSSYDNKSIVAVAAIDRDDTRASFSCYEVVSKRPRW